MRRREDRACRSYAFRVWRKALRAGWLRAVADRNVGPDLGQSYITIRFHGRSAGGVGQLAGTVNRRLRSRVDQQGDRGTFWGAVLAKIAVLVLIVLFIQKRPQGMFALKGRSAEA